MSNECMYTYVAGMYVYVRCRNTCIHMLQECMYIYVAGMHLCMLDYRNESCLHGMRIYIYIAGMYVNVCCRNICLYTLQQCTSVVLDY